MYRNLLFSLLILCSAVTAASAQQDTCSCRDSVGKAVYQWTAVKASEIDSLQSDTTVAGLIARYKVDVDRHVNQVIGHTETGWNKDGDENSSVSVFLTDLMRNYALRYLDEESDLSIMNLGGMRNTLLPGEIRLADIYQLSPFDNRIVCLEMKGSSIRHLVSDIVSVHSRFEGISGMELTLSGNRVVSIRIGGQPLDDDRLYKVITIDFLYNGGDGLDRLQEAVSVRKSNEILRNAIVRMIMDSEKKNQPVNVYPEIRVIKEGMGNE